MRHVLALLLTVLLLAMPLAAHAALADALQAVPGEIRGTNVDAVTSGYLRYILAPSRSYVAICWLPGNPGSALSGACTLSIRDGADVSVGATVSNPEFAPPGGVAVTYTPSVGGSYFVKVGATIQGLARTVLFDTTMFSPWYFIAAAQGYDGWVTVRNNTAATRSVTFRIYNSAGALIGSKSVSLPGNANSVFAIGSTLALANGQGSVLLSHDGMPGSISANLTTVSANTGLSYDNPFTARMEWSTFGAVYQTP